MEKKRISAISTDLSGDAVVEISGELRKLLADVFALYVKTKNFHWHMSGRHFRDYHLLLDEHGTQIFAMTDDIAERARKIGGTTVRSVSDISKHQRLKDNNAEGVAPEDMLAELRADNQELTRNLRSAHELCEKQALATSTGRLGRTLSPDLLARFAADRDARYAGKAPAMVPVASRDPNEVCAFPGLNAFEAFQGAQQTVAPNWRNEVTLRSLELFLAHETLGYADKISPAPLLMIVEDADTLGAADMSLDVYSRALEPKKLVILHGGHFDAYVRDQAVTARAASDWYIEHLLPEGSRGKR
jgi:starvation-inducible DNA-binding protein